MKKTMKRISVFLLVALVMAMSVVPSLAANSYTGISGGTVTIPEKLYLEKDDTVVPTVTYTLAFDSSQTAPLKENGTDTWGNTAYAYGTSGPTVTTNTVSFDSSSAVLTDGSGDWSRYVTGNFVLSFADVTFKEPGVFRFNLVKSSSGADADDTSNNRATGGYILCYVTEKNDGTLSLNTVTYINSNSTETISKIDSTTNAETVLGKDYLDQYPAINKNLTVSKRVTGDQGSKTQYFKFTIDLSGGVAGAKYKVSGTYDATTAITEYNATAYENNGSTLLKATAGDGTNGFAEGEYFITLDESGAYSGAIWMQHGQRVTIEGLAKNMTYTVDEVDETATGYTETHTNSDVMADPSDASADETGTIGDDNVIVAYTNNKSGTTPTGIVLQYGAPIAGILLVGGLFIVLMMTKRRKEQEAAE